MDDIRDNSKAMLRAAADVRKTVRRAEWLAEDPERAKLPQPADDPPPVQPIVGAPTYALRIDGRFVKEAPELIAPLRADRVKAIRAPTTTQFDEPDLAAYSCRELQRLVDTASDVIELRNIIVVDDHRGGLVIRRGSFREIRIENCTFERGLTLNGVRTNYLTVTDVRTGYDGDDAKTLRLRSCIVRDRLLLSTKNDGPYSVALLTVRGCQLAGGARMVVACSRLDLTGSVFGAPSAVSVATQAMRGVLPQLLSIASATVKDVRFEGFDLSECRMRGAQGLQSTLFARCRWSRSPGLVSRRVVYEERLWRHAWPVRTKWPSGMPRLRGDSAKGQSSLPGVPPRRWARGTADTGSSDDSDFARHLSANEVAELYRALAHGALADGDHTAAADHVWGQLTMRRLAGRERLVSGSRTRIPSTGDRMVLRIYRVVGGLGVRARWPIAVLVVLVISLAVSLSVWGFGSTSKPCDVGACLSGVHGVIEVIKTTGRATSLTVAYLLTSSRIPSGDVRYWVPAALGVGRFFSLILLGFAALALRSKVRRPN